MKRTIFLSLSLMLMQSLQAQYRVALQHNGSTQIFSGTTPFIDAYNASVDGDTIHLPGAQLSVPPSINKRLTIIGTGIHPDSTFATGRTILGSGLNLGPNADKLHLEGLVINGDINFGNDEKIDSVVIKRNYFGALNVYGTNASNYSNGIFVAENYITGAVNLQHASNAKVFNNVFQTIQNCHSNAWIANNLSYSPGWGYVVANATETLFENNAFQWGWGLNNVVNCTFIKNVFDYNPTADMSNTWVGNYVNQNWSTLFVNFQTPSNFATANYHLQNPTSFQGTTGDEIGLYGGYSPIKEGAVPFNPHISNRIIAPQTNAQGELPIQITVGAQTH
jgi:hypothetical protein